MRKKRAPLIHRPFIFPIQILVCAFAGVMMLRAGEPDAPSWSDRTAVEWQPDRAARPDFKVPSAKRIEQLQGRLESGETQMRFDSKTGYLVALLDKLRIPQASQLLVFSKTSCQRERISPRRPRAIYFNDDAYVAWIPDSPILEVSAIDPSHGAVFYSLEQKQSTKPQFVRRDQCLECHTSSRTLHVPGYLVRSYATDRDGVVDITDGCSMVDHRTPIVERWGGWYVCGSVDSLHHRGHALDGTAQPQIPSQPSALSLASNTSLVELGKYLQPTSDMVALLVLEHQAHMQNLITRVHHESLVSENPSIEIEPFVRYLLFADEALLGTSVRGVSSFASWFENQGPQDRQGRSLRQFDLKHRLFKYPCSFMIYSEAFDALPRRAKLRIYHRLWSVLNEEDSSPAFATIPEGTKRAILEILTDTKADVPVYWKL